VSELRRRVSRKVSGALLRARGHAAVAAPCACPGDGTGAAGSRDSAPRHACEWYREGQQGHYQSTPPPVRHRPWGSLPADGVLAASLCLGRPTARATGAEGLRYAGCYQLTGRRLLRPSSHFTTRSSP
jgi:hypothetical protein